MGLVKCKKCKKEVSTSAKFCPHCGESNQRLYCRECGAELPITATTCTKCGYIVNENAFYGPMNKKQVVNNEKSDQYALALTSLITSFFVPILGLILGIIVLKATKGQKDDARTFAMIGTIVSIVELILVAIILVIYFFLLFGMFALAY